MTNAFILNYDNLVTAVYSYLERSDQAIQNQMPLSIMLAEFDIATKLKILGQVDVAQFTLAAGSPANILQKPARWRKTTAMNVTVAGAKNPVLLRQKEYIETYIASGVAPGQPLYYADYDYDHWLIGPVADVPYQMEVLYYERLAPLSSDNQTNWLTNNAPQALLFGTLLQFAPFLKNDARLATWQALYTDIMGGLEKENAVRVADRDAIAIDS